MSYDVIVVIFLEVLCYFGVLFAKRVEDGFHLVGLDLVIVFYGWPKDVDVVSDDQLLFFVE